MVQNLAYAKTSVKHKQIIILLYFIYNNNNNVLHIF